MHARQHVGTVVLLCAAVGCVGRIDLAGDPGEPMSAATSSMPGPGNGGGSAGTRDPAAPGATAAAPYVVPVLPLRRLSRREYDNTVRDLLGDPSSPASAFAPDAPGPSGYEAPGPIGALETEALMAAAEKLAANAMGRLASLLPCSPKTAAEEEPCAQQFIQKFGPRAFRRPVLAEEAADLLALYRDVRQNLKLSFPDGISALLQAILQSPNFIYHRERGPERPTAEGDLVRLTSYEIASRLSYFVAGTTPDDALLQAAASGQLTDEGVLEQHARRLATKAAALTESITDFVRQWLSLDTDSLEKDRNVYPDFAAIRPLMSAELLLSMRSLVDAGSPIDALFTDRSVFVNKVSAKAYGVSPPTSDQLTRVSASPMERSGILSSWPSCR